jgi:hypothetical protein
MIECRNQIAVLWLFLAVMICPLTEDKNVVYTYSKQSKKSSFINRYNPRKIRPPPSGGGW